MRILFVGDVVGRPGRNAVVALLPVLRAEHKVDIAIVNGENAAAGAGLTGEIAKELHAAGADVITNGNHVWDQRQFMKDIDTLDFCIRPINLPSGNPGRGWMIANGVLVVNGIGRTFMAPADDPFRAMDDLLAELGDRAPRVRVLDWHAEATSEKIAMGWHLDGRFSAVVGSHTHTHLLLDRAEPREAQADLDRSIDLIGDRLGSAPAHFAYPKAVVGSDDNERLVRQRFRSASLAGTRANRYGATDPHRLARSPIQRSDGMAWFERKLAGGLGLEDAVRERLNRRRYAGRTT